MKKQKQSRVLLGKVDRSNRWIVDARGSYHIPTYLPTYDDLRDRARWPLWSGKEFLKEEVDRWIDMHIHIHVVLWLTHSSYLHTTYY